MRQMLRHLNWPAVKLRQVRTQGDSVHRVGPYRMVLPKDHALPRYQSRFPTYDRYFLEPLTRLERAAGPFTVIDVGANVGDTALAVLAAAPRSSVISVEGSPHFFHYLEANTKSLTSVRRLNAFVTPSAGDWDYERDGTTGRLVPSDCDSDAPGSVTGAITPAELCQLPESELVIWKSDTDGLDLPILIGSWDEITERCSVLWLEFDPAMTPADDVSEFLAKLENLGRDAVVFDNFGQPMLRLPSAFASRALRELAEWLLLQERSGKRHVYYLDVWIAPPATADTLFGSAAGVAGPQVSC